MKNRLNFTSICLYVVLILAMLAVLKFKYNREARQTQKAVGQIMFNFRQGRDNVLQDVPADGLWHDCSKWPVSGDVSCVRVRRQKENPDILEAQLVDQKHVSSLYNIKVRINQ
jgi:hypothetical protein